MMDEKICKRHSPSNSLMPLVATILQLDFMIHKESRLISNEVRQLFLSSLQTSACYSHAPAFQLDFPKQTCYTDATPS